MLKRNNSGESVDIEAIDAYSKFTGHHEELQR
jgi:hypothetical protein